MLLILLEQNQEILKDLKRIQFGLKLEINKRKKEKREKQKEKKNAETKKYWAKGTGYGTSSDAQNTWDQTTYAKIIELKAKQQAMMITAITSFLDVPHSNETSNLGPVNDVYELLDSSSLLPVVLSFLRNDSLLDIAKQMDIYNSLFRLIQVTARHPALVPLLDILPNESSSVVQLLSQLSSMAQMMLKTADKAKKFQESNTKTKEDSKKELEETQMAYLIVQVAKEVKEAIENKKTKKQEEIKKVSAMETGAKKKRFKTRNFRER